MEYSLKAEQKSSNSLVEVINVAQELFRYLLKRWWVFFIIGLVGGVLGLLYATFQKPKYEAKLTFSLDDNGGGLGGAFSLAAEFGLNLGGGGKDIFAGENIITILTSRRIVEDVLLSVDTVNNKPITIADYYMKMGSNRMPFQDHPRLGNIHFPAGQSRNSFSYLQDSILYTLYDRIVSGELNISKPDKKLNLYQVLFKSGEQRFCKIFTEKVVAAAIKFYTDMRVKRSKETVEILEARVGAMRGSAQSAIQSRASIQDENVNPAFAMQGAELQKKQMDATAYGAAYGELFKNLEMARYQYLKDIPLLQIIDAPNYPMKNLKTGRMKATVVGGITAGIFTFLVLLSMFVFSKVRYKIVQSKHSEEYSKV